MSNAIKIRQHLNAARKAALDAVLALNEAEAALHEKNTGRLRTYAACAQDTVRLISIHTRQMCEGVNGLSLEPELRASLEVVKR